MSRKSMIFVVILVIIFTALPGYAQESRVYVEVEVCNGPPSMSLDEAYSAGLSFSEAIDLTGLESLEPPDTGFFDPLILEKFLPPPIKGSMATVEAVDGPRIKKDKFECYAYVKYLREKEDQNYWDEIRIYIRDTKKGTSVMKLSLNNQYGKYTDSTIIKGHEATIAKFPSQILSEYNEVKMVVTIPPQSIDWTKIVEAAKDGTRQGIQVWSCTAKFNSGTIDGSALTIPMGSLEGQNFSKVIIDEIMALDVPVQIALAFAEPVWSGWEFWSSTFNIKYPNAFPQFSNFPGPVAPPTPASPIQVANANFDYDKLTCEKLKPQIIGRLGKWKNDPEAQDAVEDFAEWFDECFIKTIAQVQILNLQGQGSIPSYNPPKTPSGPVEHGAIVVAPVTFIGFEF
jgi:hypothetical protein